MSITLLPRLGLFLAISLASAAHAGSERDRELVAPDKFKVSAEADNAKFYLGEQILVDYIVENTGDAPFRMTFGGDYRGTVRALRFKVTAQDKDGNALADPYPSAGNLCTGGMMPQPELKPGEKYFASIDLYSYVRLDKPGVYTVHVSHDLGWKKDAEKTEKARTAEVKIELLMPSAAQAQSIVNKILALPEDFGGTMGQRRQHYRDLSTLQYPVYLPILRKLAQDGNKEALSTLGAIATPEAAQTLIELLDSKDREFAREAAGTLNLRLPDPRWDKSLQGRGPFQEMFSMDSERQALSAAGWRADLAPAVRKAALVFLDSNLVDDQQVGAYAIQCVGAAEDAPALMKALDAALEATRTLPLETNLYPRPRGSCEELLRAAEMLMQRGVRPVDEPARPSEIAMFLTALLRRPDFRPAGWEARCLKWLEHPIPMIRELTLKYLPRPAGAEFIKALPRLILDDNPDVQIAACQMAEQSKAPELKESVLECFRTAKEQWVTYQAKIAANALNANYEIALILAGRLDTDLSKLSDLITTVIKTGSYGTIAVDPSHYAGLKARWQEFLKKHEARLRRHELFEPPDPEIDPDLVPGWTFTLKDGTQWPKR